MSNHESVLDALDGFFRTVRMQAENDPEFAATLVHALSIPVNLEFVPKDLAKGLPYIDPVILAGRGVDEFRKVFSPLSDAQLRKVIVHFNIASKDAVPAKGGPKADELVDLLWQGALARRQQMQRAT